MELHNLFLATFFAVLLTGTAIAAPYQAQQSVQGEIRIWGSPEDAALIKLWEEGFRNFHPQAHISAKLHGPESTMAGIYTGVADIAFVGREMRLPVENMAFEWVKLHKPTTIVVANAGLRSQRVAATLGVFVHRDNPLAGLSFAQLDAIFGAERKRGGVAVTTWGRPRTCRRLVESSCSCSRAARGQHRGALFPQDSA